MGVRLFESSAKENRNVEEVCHLGNKDDDASRKRVESADAKRFSEQMGVRLFESSAKENRNVEEMFLTMTRLVLRVKKESQARLRPSEVVTISKAKKKPHVKRCC
ncbi:ras-related protein Rab-35-like [Ascaphus truei]|uniref:ras-related protein Rab-35-like n=1 Tax=Ascaphus truei TaxID=8439 RepID=UPI003F5A2B20